MNIPDVIKKCKLPCHVYFNEVEMRNGILFDFYMGLSHHYNICVAQLTLRIDILNLEQINFQICSVHATSL